MPAFQLWTVSNDPSALRRLSRLYMQGSCVGVAGIGACASQSATSDVLLDGNGIGSVLPSICTAVFDGALCTQTALQIHCSGQELCFAAAIAQSIAPLNRIARRAMPSPSCLPPQGDNKHKTLLS